MNRREFIERACLTGIGVAIGISELTALSIPTLQAAPRLNSFTGKREIPIRLEDTPELKEIGSAYHLTLDEMEKDLLVVHMQDDTYLAIDIKCTHKGCEVKFEDKSNMFVCPCHDSRFDINGKPKSGPATTPLTRYKTSFKDGEVLIEIPVEGETPAMKSDSSKVDSTKKK
ncbi:MAG: Rieske (2Fe-2S) protein [bacterium]